MSYQANKVKRLYAIITILSIVSVLWYILKIILGAAHVIMPRSLDSTISFVISLFILIDLTIMIIIWKHMTNFRDERLRAWAALSIVLYIIIILLNVAQGTFPLLNKGVSIHVTGSGLPSALLVFTLINFFTVRKSKKTLKSYN